MENVLTPTKIKHVNSSYLFNFKYKGVNYKFQFYQEDNANNGWFCSVWSKNESKLDLYPSDVTDGVLSAFDSLKEFKRCIERLASEGELNIMPEEYYDKWLYNKL